MEGAHQRAAVRDRAQSNQCKVGEGEEAEGVGLIQSARVHIPRIENVQADQYAVQGCRVGGHLIPDPAQRMQAFVVVARRTEHDQPVAAVANLVDRSLLRQPSPAEAFCGLLQDSISRLSASRRRAWIGMTLPIRQPPPFFRALHGSLPQACSGLGFSIVWLSSSLDAELRPTVARPRERTPSRSKGTPTLLLHRCRRR